MHNSYYYGVQMVQLTDGDNCCHPETVWNRQVAIKGTWAGAP